MAYYDSKNIKTQRMNEKELGWKKREKQHSEFQFNLETVDKKSNLAEHQLLNYYYYYYYYYQYHNNYYYCIIIIILTLTMND